jgi:hypothetical protein
MVCPVSRPQGGREVGDPGRPVIVFFRRLGHDLAHDLQGGVQIPSVAAKHPAFEQHRAESGPDVQGAGSGPQHGSSLVDIRLIPAVIVAHCQQRPEGRGGDGARVVVHGIPAQHVDGLVENGLVEGEPVPGPRGTRESYTSLAQGLCHPRTSLRHDGWRAWVLLSGTKFLYFCSPAASKPALIFDRLVAAWLRENADLSLNEARWSVRTYRRYLQTMFGWAGELDVAADVLEACIFSEQAGLVSSQWAASRQPLGTRAS